MPVRWKIDHYERRDYDGSGDRGDKITNNGWIAPIGLHFTKVLSEACSIDYGVSLRDDRYIKHDWVTPYEHEFVLSIYDGITYDGFVVMEGQVTNHGIRAASELSQVTGQDFINYFDRRGYPLALDVDGHLQDPYPYKQQWGPDNDVTQILYDIFLTIFQDTPGAPNIVPPSFTSLGYGVPEGYRLEYGTTDTYRSIVDNFAKGYPGFDYGFAQRTFNIYAPEYDPTHTAVLLLTENSRGEIPGVLDVDWNNNGIGASHALGSGAGIGTTLIQNYSYQPTQDRYGRLDIFPNFGDLLSLDQIKRATAGTLGRALAPMYELSIILDADLVETPNGFWHDIVPGAYIFIKKDLKGHMLNGLYKIVQLDCNVTNEGQAIVTLSCNRETDLSLNFDNIDP